MPLTMTQDFTLGFRMLLKHPGLTLAGGLALAIAIGVGAGWWEVWGKLLSPTIPLPSCVSRITSSRGGGICGRSRAWARTARASPI
jgi:hypothetical protein